MLFPCLTTVILPSASHDFLTQKYLKKPQKFTTMSYNCNFMYFQYEPSANPLRLLVNSRVGGHMLVNLKNVSKTSPLLNNNNNNGLNLPVTGAVKTKWHFYRFQPYPSKAIPNMETYESTVSSVKLFPQCLHALHVFLHGLHYCITTHHEDVPRSANYRFISVVGGHYHIDCIGEYCLVIANTNSDICM